MGSVRVDTSSTSAQSVAQSSISQDQQPDINTKPKFKDPTPKQIEANYLSRILENGNALGSGAAIAYATTTFNNDLSSDGITANIQISNALRGIAALTLMPILNFFIRKYYRTGKYKFAARSRCPQNPEIEAMKEDDIIIYSLENKLHYIVKGKGGDNIEGEIEENQLDSGYFQKLRECCGDAQTPIPQECETAILKITAQRFHTYSGKISLNPLYRTFKILSRVGGDLGVTLSYFLGNNRNEQRLISYILSNVLSVVVGLFAFPYWLIREKIFKIPPNSEHKYDLTAREGWSKYARTAQVMGMAIGQVIGGLVVGAVQHASAAATSFSIALWGGIAGLATFTLAMTGVPLINWITSKFTQDGKGILVSDSKNVWRNNYMRSGVVLGASIGALLGLSLGPWLFGPVMAGTIFSALGSVIGGIALSIYGQKLHRKFHLLEPGEKEEDENIENSWDYVSRSSASVFSYVGAALACIICPTQALLVAPLGAAIAGGLGWGLGLMVMCKARQVDKYERQAEVLPWTQRITSGANVGSILGSGLGVIIGFSGLILSGPVGLIFAISLFGAAGAIIGGIGGALYEEQARKLVYKGIKSFFVSSVEDSHTLLQPTLSPTSSLAFSSTLSQNLRPPSSSTLSQITSPCSSPSITNPSPSGQPSTSPPLPQVSSGNELSTSMTIKAMERITSNTQLGASENVPISSLIPSTSPSPSPHRASVRSQLSTFRAIKSSDNLSIASSTPSPSSSPSPFRERNSPNEKWTNRRQSSASPLFYQPRKCEKKRSLTINQLSPKSGNSTPELN